MFLRDEKRSNHATNDEHVLEGPEPILDSGSRIVWRLDINHDQGHQREEERDYEAKSGSKRNVLITCKLENLVWKDQKVNYSGVSLSGLDR